jgi:biofilm PGA synthesis N-glycosyltransferase PgaC
VKQQQQIDAMDFARSHEMPSAKVDTDALRAVPDSHAGRDYVLITAAHNEEEHIERVIAAVAGQTRRPKKWIIVSDGSSDRTDEIVQEHAACLPFIELVSRARAVGHNFASKVHALNEGAGRMNAVEFDFIGHLDADVSFASTYYADLLEEFDLDPKLGLAGGSICEWNGDRYAPRPFNQVRSVPGSVQLFRRQCYQALGGFRPLPYGGEDWCAEVTVRMNGWRVRCFPGLPVCHHRFPNDTIGRLRSGYRQGMMDFSIGTHPMFEVLRLARRSFGKPRILGAIARLCGFARAAIRAEDRVVSDEFIAFLRSEEMSRLRWLVRRPANSGTR